MTKLVLTAIGDDRVGLVSALSGAVADHGGNWLESEMARLGGKFAGIVLIDLDDEAIEAFTDAVDRLDDLLNVTVTPAGAPANSSTGEHLALHLLGADRPGIVNQIAQSLFDLGASIEELATDLREAPMAGGMLFEADAVVRLPVHVSRAQVAATLEAIADELMVDIDLAD